MVELAAIDAPGVVNVDTFDGRLLIHDAPGERVYGRSVAGDPDKLVLPLGVGAVVPHFAVVVPNDGWLPMSNGIFNDADYPELAAVIAAGNKVGTNLGDGTFRLLDLNGALNDGRGRVLEGLGTRTSGDLQDDATALNGLHLRTSAQAGGNAFDAQTSMYTNSGNAASQGSVILGGGDFQSRAPAASVLWMVRAKPWTAPVDPVDPVVPIVDPVVDQLTGTQTNITENQWNNIVGLEHPFPGSGWGTLTVRFALSGANYVHSWTVHVDGGASFYITSESNSLATATQNRNEQVNVAYPGATLSISLDNPGAPANLRVWASGTNVVGPYAIQWKFDYFK